MSTEPGRGRTTATRVLASLTVVTSWIAAAAVAVMLVHIIAHTALRQFGRSGLQGTLEYVRFWWLMLMVFGGLAIAQRRGDHISAPILFDRLGPRARRWWELVGNALVIAIVVLMAWYGWKGAMAQMSIGARASGTRIITWPTALFVPIGMTLFAVEVTLATVLRWDEPDVLDEVDGSAATARGEGPAT